MFDAPWMWSPQGLNLSLEGKIWGQRYFLAMHGLCHNQRKTRIACACTCTWAWTAVWCKTRCFPGQSSATALHDALHLA